MGDLRQFKPFRADGRDIFGGNRLSCMGIGGFLDHQIKLANTGETG
jgi:hypothetical protein